jgi:hypothetical protein
MPTSKRSEFLQYMKQNDKNLWRKLAIEFKLAQIWKGR